MSQPETANQEQVSARSPVSPAGWVLLVQLDLDVYAGGQFELHQGIDCLVGRVDYVHQALMGADLVLVTRVLVDVGRDQDREALHFHGQGDRSLDGRPGPFGGIDNLPRGVVDEAVVERLQAYAYVLICCHDR